MSEIPLPPAVAARPRDQRGYPVPAITPWQGDQPRFAATGIARTYICAVERRCSICGLTMAAGPVWRVVAGPEADAIAAGLAGPGAYANAAATAEAPGHRACMLYAAVACPYLAHPTARRGQDAVTPTLAAHRGDRGGGGAVAGFAAYRFRIQQGTVLFRFTEPAELLAHTAGTEQLDRLVAAIAAEPPPPGPGPGYLDDDEAAAERRCTELLSRQDAVT
ncbi:hypothetical protein QEZ54_02160 [Catellatospora sp. KI3]|uniref:hypothetical protein n=1 Tax=Catellatospora sp. KI3 TaxID=3041620 RepID=UPI002482E354|nr:hypothetical protein [Catellatospora sp. KI3]MDI1459763.1 hypothetical protein [Catellatospora sp. KI3]